jgi:hypothetical protein
MVYYACVVHSGLLLTATRVLTWLRKQELLGATQRLTFGGGALKLVRVANSAMQK